MERKGNGIAAQIIEDNNGCLTQEEVDAIQNCIRVVLTRRLTEAELDKWRFLPITYTSDQGITAILSVFDRKARKVYGPVDIEKVINPNNDAATEGPEPS